MTDKKNDVTPTTNYEHELVTIVSSTEAEIPQTKDIEPSKEGSMKYFASVIAAYREYYIQKNNTNISLRKKFFNCSFALLFIIVIGFIAAAIVVCLFVKDNVASIISLVTSIGGLVSTVIVLPKQIGKYIFPQDEFDGAKDIITTIDNSITEYK